MLKTSLLSFNSLPKEFHIFTVHNVSINEEVFLCCIKINHLVLTLSNSSDINSDKVKGKPQSRIVVGIHRERGMFALLRLLISWLRLTCVCTSNKVSNLFPVKKEMVQCQLSPTYIKNKLSWEGVSASQPSQLSQAFIWEKSWPLCLCKQRSCMLWLSKTILAHALIVSPWLSWPDWVSQNVYMEKSWLS